MNRRSLSSCSLWLFCLVLLINLQNKALAQEQESTQEPDNAGWALHIDNDLLISSTLDRDYTGGVALTFSGTQAITHPLSIDRWRAGLDRLVRFDRLYDSKKSFSLHAIEAGFVLFTPSNIVMAEPQVNDHPYASLFFLVNSEQIVLPQQNLSFTSVFTIGVLGLGIAEDIQSGIHRVTGSDLPRGWSNQISSGGEPTARYTLGAQKTVYQSSPDRNVKSEFKLMGEVNAGFTTDFSVGFNGRVGRLNTPWWGFNPHQAEYVNLGSPIVRNELDDRGKEFFFYFGVNAKVRLYNSVLQGQFRDSAVSFDLNELEAVVVETWAGVSLELSRRWKLGGFARTRTSELKNSNREPLWGGVLISRAY